MGLIAQGMQLLFGSGRNVVTETAEVFRVNAEAQSAREVALTQAAMAQFGQEFQPTRSWFDGLMDGLNRLPRPFLAFGTLGLFVSAMVDPVWFASRMEGIALVPEPLWWLMGAIVSFYFGARHQAHTQAFQRSIAETLARVPRPEPVEPIATVPTPARAAVAAPVQQFARGSRPSSYQTGPNKALDDWFALAA